MGGGVHSSLFEKIISVENLLIAWKEFVKGKRKRVDVQEFQLRLMANILSLHNDLRNKTYMHGSYEHFKISDPKPRDIHKATVRDRLAHHAIYRILYPFFNKKFIFDSYSCRVGKGTHKAISRFTELAKCESFSHTKTCWVLKCDICKFFANIDHDILKRILSKYIHNSDILWLIEQIISSFNSGTIGKGLPLGNLTSQLFVNIYMNEFDQFIKHKLNIKYYIRYADDFVVFSQNKEYLLKLIPTISDFLQKHLKLSLHPNKVFIKTAATGVDFLGWVHFPTHRVLRTTTKRRMFAKVDEENLVSYLGLLKHGNAWKLTKGIRTVCC